MRVLSSIALTVSVSPFFAQAHFELKSPPPRGYNRNALAEYPCGGSNTQSNNRSQFPLTGGPIQLDMGHDHAMVQVNLALGNEAVDGNAFTINLLPTIQQAGLGDFCLGNVVIPSNLNVKDGDNATIQVITSGDPSGGLYNCADVTFSSSAQPGDCTNGTNVKSEAVSDPAKNANGTDASTATTSASSTPSPSVTGTAGAAASGVAMEMLASVIGVAFMLQFL